jgi:hypothetical protein
LVNSDRHMFNYMQSLCSLLKTYEKSICTSILKRDHRLAWVNASQHEILSSRMPLGSNSVAAYTYGWASEMMTRAQTMEFLINHELTDMIVDLAQSWPTLNLPKEALSQRIAHFKKHSFLLLYRLADCSTSLTQTLKIRANQAEFLESLTSSELASLGVIVEVMGTLKLPYFHFILGSEVLGNSSRNYARATRPMFSKKKTLQLILSPPQLPNIWCKAILTCH